MKPTIDEIQQQLVRSDTGSQVVIISKDEADQSGFVESIVLHIRDWVVKLFRSPTIKKVLFAVVMSLAAFDGTRICILGEQKTDQLLDEYSDSERWIESIIANRDNPNANGYFVLGGPGNPSPTEATFNGPDFTIMAPISGALALSQNETFQVFNSGSNP